MFTDAERKQLMQLIHAIVRWQADNAADDDAEYEGACVDLHSSVDSISPDLIQKLIAAVNMKTMRSMDS